MHINGKYRLACETQILELNAEMITIQPLGHLQVLRDLIVDFTPFYKNYSRIKPYLVEKEPVPEKEYIQIPEERNKIGNTIDCILCGACFGACLTVGTNDAYLGPSALLKAERFLSDSRDNMEDERLKIVNLPKGTQPCRGDFKDEKKDFTKDNSIIFTFSLPLLLFLKSLYLKLSLHC